MRERVETATRQLYRLVGVVLCNFQGNDDMVERVADDVRGRQETYCLTTSCLNHTNFSTGTLRVRVRPNGEKIVTPQRRKISLKRYERFGLILPANILQAHRLQLTVELGLFRAHNRWLRKEGSHG